MTDTGSPNKFRAAIEVLQRGRDRLVESLAEEVVDQGDDLLDSGFMFHEMIETQGTKLHFLGLLLAHLEQSAEATEEEEHARSAPPPPPIEEAPKRKRKPRAKRLS